MRVSNNTKYFQDGSYVQYQSKFDEHNNWLETRDKYFNNKSQCHYIKKYNNQGVFYEEWRTYYDNGVLKEICNSQGFKLEFNEKGLARI